MCADAPNDAEVAAGWWRAPISLLELRQLSPVKFQEPATHASEILNTIPTPTRYECSPRAPPLTLPRKCWGTRHHVMFQFQGLALRGHAVAPGMGHIHCGLPAVTTAQHFSGEVVAVPASVGRPLVGPSHVPLDWEPRPTNYDVSLLLTDRYVLHKTLLPNDMRQRLLAECEGLAGVTQGGQ